MNVNPRNVLGHSHDLHLVWSLGTKKRTQAAVAYPSYLLIVIILEPQETRMNYLILHNIITYIKLFGALFRIHKV